MKASYRAAIISFTLVSVGCVHSPREIPFDVVIRGPATTCNVSVNGREVTGDELLLIARAEATLKGRAIIDADPDASYRCIGGTIYTLQWAGFLKIGFTSDSGFGETDRKVR